MHAAQLADIELPESVQQALQESRQPAEDLQHAQIVSLTNVLLEKRRTAIDGRKESGIEAVWDYCDDAYIGIDDANRHEFNNNRWYKPLSKDTGVEKGQVRDGGSRSTLYIPLTRRYVNAGVAKVIEMATSPDERPFAIEPTPVPDLIKQSKDLRPVLGEDGQPLQRDPTPIEVNPGSSGTPEHPLPVQTPPAQDLSQAPGKPLTHADLAKEKMKQATEAAEQAGKRIHDWMVEGRFLLHDRRVIGDGGRIGTGILKGPVADISQSVVATQGKNGLEIVLREEIKPVPKRVRPRNFYPDPACGEDIHNGGYTWERDELSRGMLQKMAKLPGYNERAIAQILREDPRHIVDDEQQQKPIGQRSSTRMPYEAWFLYGSVTRAEYELVRQTLNSAEDLTVEDELTDVPIQATVVNDQIIQLIPQPLNKSGRFPYHVFNWLHRDGFWAGIGIAEQGIAPQRIVNSAGRREIDNAGFAAGMQLILNRELLEPLSSAPGKNPWEIEAVKLWALKHGHTVDDIRKLMHVVQFPSAHEQLAWLIEFGIRLFEEVTNIPLVSQGWSGKSTPDTFGATNIQNTNANQMIRDVAMNHDLCVIVPFVQQCYEWLLLDPSVPDEEKGDVKIFARGATVLVERALQKQAFAQYLPFIMQGHRDLEISLPKVFEELWRAERMNPALIRLSEEELDAKAKQPPPEPPEVSVAKMRGEIEMQKVKAQHDYNMKELELRREIAQLEFQAAVAKMTSDERKALENNKRSLAETTMELRTQKEISLQRGQADQVANPATEPPGRAPDGQAFER